MKAPAGKSLAARHVFGRCASLCLILVFTSAPALRGQAPRRADDAFRPHRFTMAQAAPTTFALAPEMHAGSQADRDASFGRVFLGAAAGGVLVGLMSGGTMAFTGWGLTGGSTTVAKTMGYVGGIPGVPVGSAAGLVWATAGTDREVGVFGALARSFVGSAAGMVVWHNVAGEMIPEEHDAKWRRGLAAGLATHALVSTILTYAF